MHKGPAEARRFAQDLLQALPSLRSSTCGLESSGSGSPSPEVAVFPPFVALAAVADALRGTGVAYGGQNCHWESKGAFTGEVAAAFLAELGCKYVLVGHSERRTLFGETDETCRLKVRAALKAGVQPLLCCGETLAEREAGQTFAVVERQLRAVLSGLDPAEVVTIAYEPVWAIGTDRTATPSQAEEAHRFIRDWLAGNRSPGAAARTRILYGGSVKPDNTAELLGQPDVNGALVGGASLDLASFTGIIRACNE
jgi:triosephosphate isomerase